MVKNHHYKLTHWKKTLEWQNSYEVQTRSWWAGRATKKWRDSHKIWAEYKDKLRKEAVANFRLKTGHDCLAAHLRITDIYESSDCTICQMPNSTTDEEHLLYCPKLDTDQQVLENTIKLYWDARAMITSPPSVIGKTNHKIGCRTRRPSTVGCHVARSDISQNLKLKLLRLPESNVITATAALVGGLLDVGCPLRWSFV